MKFKSSKSINISSNTINDKRTLSSKKGGDPGSNPGGAIFPNNLTFSSITEYFEALYDSSNKSQSFINIKKDFAKLTKWKLKLLMKAISQVRKEKYVRNRRVLYKGIARIFTDKQLNTFFSVIHDPNHLFAFKLQYFLALRVGEVSLIKVKDCLLDEQKIKITCPKKDTYDFLPLVEPLYSMISYRINALNLHKDDSLVSYNNNYLRNLFRKYRDKSGLNTSYAKSKDGRNLGIFSTHVLRATSITNFYKYTRDTVKTKNFARHDNINSTMVYIRIIEEDLKEGMEGAFL